MADEEQEVDEQVLELDRQIRTSKALQAMERELQLSTADVMPVLLRLLKTFDGKWQHIEDENYRLLADMIFQQQEAAEAEKAPGSSSGGGRKPNGKKKVALVVRATPRRAPRNSKRVESDDSDETDHPQEPLRRSKRVPGDVVTYAAGIASLERAVVARRGRPSVAARHDDDDNPAWAPPLALHSPLPREPQGRGRRVEFVKEVAGVDKQTQTEAADFEALSHQEPIQPTAIICYGEPNVQRADVQPMAVVKQEDAVVFLPASQVRRQILNHVAPLKRLSGDVCHKCEKPKASVSGEKSKSTGSNPSKSLVFDPYRVKVEGQGAASGKRNDPPLLCLNPEPLQSVVPTAPQPPGMAVTEPPDQHLEVHTPEPLLLTFPSEGDGAGTPELPKVLVPCSVQSSIAEPLKELAPCGMQTPIEVDANAGSSSEPKDPLSKVENPSMKVEVARLTSKVEAEVKVAGSSTHVEAQQPTENSIPESALAALASYISESDNEEDTDMSPKLEPRVRTVEGIEDGVEQGKREEVRGVLPLANTSSMAVLADASSRTETLPDSHPPNPNKIILTRSAQESELTTNPDDAGTAKEETKQSSGTTSSEAGKKRKRHLIKKHEQEQEAMAEKRKQRYDTSEDISKGKETVAISLSAPNGEQLPDDFYYVNASVVYQSAHVGISMARIGEDDRCTSCVGNCLDNRTPCECTRLTTGEYAYTVEGQLYPHFLKQELERKSDMKYLAFCQPGACPVERTSDENCKGHVQRRFIKECWEKCGCTQLCGNRIVQRGITRRLQVFWTEGGKGWGVRTLEHLPAGTFVCEYVGEILTNTEMWFRNKEVHRTAKHHFALQLDADWCSEKILQDEEALCLDGTFYGNVARFINHRCLDCNLLEIPVEIESPDHHYYHLAFFTSKEVTKNEELTWDYQLDFNDKDHQLQAFECFCGSSFCRGKVEDGKPWV